MLKYSWYCVISPEGCATILWRDVSKAPEAAESLKLTSDDLLFTVQVGREKRARAFSSPAWDMVEAAEASDSRTITLWWSTSYIDADTMFTHLAARGSPLPRHLLEASYSESPEGFNDLPYWNQAFVGAGPFKLAESRLSGRGSSSPLRRFLGLMGADGCPNGCPNSAR